MKTLPEFLDWCRNNPDTLFYRLPYAQYQVVLKWRIAIAKHIDHPVASLRPPEIRAAVQFALAAMGDGLAEDIQRTYNDL